MALHFVSRLATCHCPECGILDELEVATTVGRPLKPTAELRLHGTYRADRHSKRVDEKAVRDGLEKPDWLDEEASWHRDLVANAYHAGVLQSVDSAMLAQASTWWSEWRKADKIVHAW